MILDERCRKLAQRCEEWGGSLLIAARRDWPPSVSAAPFWPTVGLDWCGGKVCAESSAYWPWIIHEMAHVFAMKEPPWAAGPTEPVGWQFMVACHLDAEAGADWVKAFRAVGYDVGKNFRDMPDAEFAWYMAWTTSYDRERGLLDGLTPLAIRRPSFSELAHLQSLVTSNRVSIRLVPDGGVDVRA